MNCVLADFLDRLSEFPGTDVVVVKNPGASVVAQLTHRGHVASLVCDADAPPMGQTRRGSKVFSGAYVVENEGYGDWIKGNDGSECFACAICWMRARAARTSGTPIVTSVDFTAGAVHVDPDLVSLPMLRIALERRAGIRIEGASLVWPDGANVSLEGAWMVETIDGSRLEAQAPTVGQLAAAVLGFMDGVSDGSDE